MNTNRSIQDTPTTMADREYFAELTAQTQDALWDLADTNLMTYRMTIGAAWKSAIKAHKAMLRDPS